MRGVAVECEGIKRVWLLSRVGCVQGAVVLLSVINAQSVGMSTAVKQLLKAKHRSGGDGENDYLFGLAFEVPVDCDVWLMRKSGQIEGVSRERLGQVATRQTNKGEMILVE